jgi:hypothetical protein
MTNRSFEAQVWDTLSRIDTIDHVDQIKATAKRPMDNYFNPIPHPTARQLNDSRQRALVKALAFAGLALNLWGDSVIPVGTLADPIDPNQVEVIEGLIKSTGSDLIKFLSWCEADSVEEIPVERYSSAVALLEAKAKRSKAAPKPAAKAAPKAKAEPEADKGATP